MKKIEALLLPSSRKARRRLLVSLTVLAILTAAVGPSFTQDVWEDSTPASGLDSGSDLLTRGLSPTLQDEGEVKASPDGVWREVQGRSKDSAFAAGQSGANIAQGVPAGARVVRLDDTALVRLLRQAQSESVTAARDAETLLSLPLPGGSYALFHIVESPVMEPGLAERFPEIKSYSGQGADDPRMVARLDLSPRGLNATILNDGRVISIHPARYDDTTNYVSYFGDEFQAATALACGVREAGLPRRQVKKLWRESSTAGGEFPSSLSTGATLRTFRLAVATSREYTNDPALGGGTVAGTVASLNTWLNAVNVVYERELAVRLILVNNTNIIFASEPDGLTNDNKNTALSEIKHILESQVGLSNYDVGHVLLNVPGGGGLASGSVVCRTDNLKGGGVTEVGAPVGNFNGVHVFAHELGHQFGASHTYNGCARSESGRSAVAAYEVGGGITIMSHGGLCDTDNVVASRGDTELRFHAGTYAQINSYLANTSCAATSATGNSPPTVDAGFDYTIPKLTPFMLTASASDPDAGDMLNLTYAWEQFDAGGTSYLNPRYDDSEDTSATTRPIFRPYPPTTDPTRTFPKLSYVLDYANDPPETLDGLRPGEELPRVGRILNFRVTARDNRAGGGGVGNDSVVLTVDGGSGPFALTAPNTAVNWPGGSTQTVTWDVNNTNVAPVGAASVSILLSTDGGHTFPIVLASSTNNDGGENVPIPNGLLTSTARIKVEAIGNIFFDISDKNFHITPDATRPSATGVSPGMAATLSGSLDVGAGQALTSLTNPGGLFDYLNANALGGDLTVYLTSDLNAETGTIQLGQLTEMGAGGYHVTIRPQGGAVRVISGSGTPLIGLSGADRITFDGLNAGGNSLTIRNTNNSGATISLTNDASNNVVRNCTVEGGNTSATSGVISFGSGTTNGNDNNTITNNNIRDRTDAAATPANGIYSHGLSSSASNSGNVISNNNIFNFFTAATNDSAGVRLEGHNTGWTLSGNSLYQTTPRAATGGVTSRAIYINNSGSVGNNFVVTGNSIGGGAPGAAGAAWTVSGSFANRFEGISLNVGASTASSVQNNIVTNFAWTSNSTSSTLPGVWCGIYVNGGEANVGTAMGNVIGGGSGPVNVTGAPAGSVSVGVGSSSGNAVNISNNVVSSMSIAAGQVRGIMTTSGVNTISGNTVTNLSSSSTTTASQSNAPVIGISQSSATAGQTVSRNVVYNLTGTAPGAAVGVTGIHYQGGTSGTNVIAGNLVHSLSLSTSSNAALITGINASGGAATYRNNMVRLGLDAGGSSLTAGYAIKGVSHAAGASNFYFNTLFVGGSGVASGSATYAFRSDAGSGTRNFRGNVFVNNRANAAGTASNYIYGVGGAAPNPAGLTSNDNLFYSSNSSGHKFSVGGMSYADFAAYKAANPSLDTASLSGDPLLINPTGNGSTLKLHALATSPGANNTGAAGIVTGGGAVDDFDGEARSTTAPDLGADEINPLLFGCGSTIQAGTYSDISTSCAGGTVLLGGDIQILGTLDVAANTELRNTSGNGYTITMSGASSALVVNGSIGGAGNGEGNTISLLVSGAQTTVSGTGALARLLNLSVNSGSTLVLQGGGDLRLHGDFTCDGTFNSNNRAVFFEGNATQTLNAASGSLSLPYVRIAKSGGTVRLGNTNLTTLGPAGGDSMQFEGTSSTLTLNGRTLTLGSTVGTAAEGSGLVGDSGAGLSLQDGGATGALGTLVFVEGGRVLENLTINRTGGSGTAALGSDLTLAGLLSLEAGDLLTGSFTLTQQGDSAGTGDVIGNVRRTDLGVTAREFGNPHNRLSFQAGTAPTAITFNLLKSKPAGANGFTNAVNRTYTITPTGGSNFVATLRLRYLDAELNGNNEVLLDLWRHNGNWNRVPKTAADTESGNWVESSLVTRFSPWTLSSAPLAPTAAKLRTFGASASRTGVTVEWQTSFELDNLGFNLYREQDGARTLVTPSPVAGSALLVGERTALAAGNSYSWFDAGAELSARYYLEEIDLSGAKTLHGPFGVGATRDGARGTSRPALVSQLGEAESASQHEWPVTLAGRREVDADSTAASRAVSFDESAASRSPSARQRELAALPGVKLHVRRGGWYRVTRAELEAVGLSPTADPTRLRLYTDGVEQSVRVDVEEWVSGGGGAVEFYGEGLDTPSTDTRVYWLIEGEGGGRRLGPAISAPYNASSVSGTTATSGGSRAFTIDAGAISTLVLRHRSGGRAASGFRYTLEYRGRAVYFSSLLNGERENFFGRAVTATPARQLFDVRHLDSNTASVETNPPRLEVALQGASAGAHRVSVFFNDSRLGELGFDGREHKAETFVVPAALLREGGNEVKMVSTAASDISLTDYIRLSYRRAYRAEGDALRFTTEGRTSVRVLGFRTPDIRVMDITDPLDVSDVPATIERMSDSEGEGYAVRVPSNGTEAPRTLYARAGAAASRVEAVLTNRPSDWNESREADFVIITHGDFRREAETLAARRAEEGLATEVVDVEDLYDEFSYGAHSPWAVKEFLAWTTRKWARSPLYVLLLGDGSLDPRDYMGRGRFDLVPSKLVDTAYMETASDGWFADFDGDGLSEMAVGRLPVRTRAEAALVVARIAAHEPAAAPRSALMVADRQGSDGYDFEAATDSVQNLLPGAFSVTRINRGAQAADAVRARIVGALDAGPSIVNWMGHGSVNVWTGEGLLRGEDAGRLANGERLPLFVLMTCLNGYYQDPLLESLSESLLKATRGGALAVWTSTGMTGPAGQVAMNRELFAALYGEEGAAVRLGDAVQRARRATADPDVRRTWVLIGDPTSRVR